MGARRGTTPRHLGPVDGQGGGPILSIDQPQQGWNIGDRYRNTRRWLQALEQLDRAAHELPRFENIRDDRAEQCIAGKDDALLQDAAITLGVDEDVIVDIIEFFERSSQVVDMARRFTKPVG